MIEAFRKIWRFAGNETKNINRSVAVSFLNALLQMTQVGAIYCVVRALTGDERSGKIALIALALELISIFGGAVASSFSRCCKRTRAISWRPTGASPLLIA